MSKLEKSIKDQINGWKENNFNYTSYYLSNTLKILFGYQPSHVSPKNKLVNSYICGFDNREKDNIGKNNIFIEADLEDIDYSKDI
jgi:hypothetical protein